MLQFSGYVLVVKVKPCIISVTARKAKRKKLDFRRTLSPSTGSRAKTRNQPVDAPLAGRSAVLQNAGLQVIQQTHLHDLRRHLHRRVVGVRGGLIVQHAQRQSLIVHAHAAGENALVVDDVVVVALDKKFQTLLARRNVALRLKRAVDVALGVLKQVVQRLVVVAGYYSEKSGSAGN